MNTPDPTADFSYLLDMGPPQGSGRAARLDAGRILSRVLQLRWLLIGVFCLAMLTGIYLAATLPRTYRSESTILVEPQSVPDKYVHSTVPIEIDARIASLAQQILSVSNLMDLIERFKLFADGPERNLFIEEKVEKMRRRLHVKIADEEFTKNRRGGSRASAFMISYEDPDPRKAYQVVNAIATFVIDQNLKMRQTVATGTSEFLSAELNRMRARLEEVEKALEEYRRVNMGELPEQLPSNLAVLDRLEQQLRQVHQNLRDEKNRLLIVETQLKFAQQMPPSSASGVPAPPETGPAGLEALRQQLAALLAKYTESHPDVVALKKKIEALEKEMAEGGAPPQPPPAAAPPVAPGGRPPLAAELLGQQQAILRNIKALEGEALKIQEQIEYYQKRVENTPKREQELLLLKRDYDNIKATYSSVLNRKLEADIALNMEKTQKGEQFRILDPPRMAEKPISPDLRMIFLACLVAGLGGGAGVVFLFEFFDRSVRKPEALQMRFSLPVLLVMPEVEHLQPRRRRVLVWLNHALSAAGALACLALLAGLAAVTLLDASAVERVKELLKSAV
ncbi:MAG: GNVR domain-containing protein [Desulfobacterales bacterium]